MSSETGPQVDDRGTAVVETALLFALVAVVCIAALQGLGRSAAAPLDRSVCALGARHTERCNLVRNGDFEGFDMRGRRWVEFGVGAFAWAGWRVTSGTVDLHDSSFNGASDGGTSVDLNGTSGGALATSVDTSGGEDLLLTFDVAENTTGGPDVKGMAITWNGTLVQTLEVDTDAPMSAPGWTRRTVVLPAGSGATGELILSSTTPTGSAGVMIDNVNVVPRSAA